LLLVALLDLVISMLDQDGPSQLPPNPIPVESNLPEADGQPLEAGTEERNHAGFSLWKLTLAFAAVAAVAGGAAFVIFGRYSPSTSTTPQEPEVPPKTTAAVPQEVTPSEVPAPVNAIACDNAARTSSA